MTSSLLIVDSRVLGWRHLIDSLNASTHWELIDPDSDGLERLAQLVERYADLNSIQIISHGSSGSFKLGSTEIDLETLKSHVAAFASIGNSLSPDGDILLYGCDIGHGIEGLQFITNLAQLTGADVAASSNATGPASLGGDSILELTVGAVTAQPAFSASGIDVMPSLLGNTPMALSPGSGTWLRPNPNNAYSTSGSIGTTTQVDVWALMPEVDGRYTISVGGSSIDAKMRLYNNTGSQSAEVNGETDRAGAGQPESITVNLIAGFWYYVAVTGFGTTTGSYSLNAEGPAFSATSIAVGGTANTGNSPGTINHGGDTDYFKVVAPSGATTMTVQVGPGSGLDTRPWLYDGSGRFLKEFDSRGSGGFDELIDQPVVAGNTYFVSVAAFSATSTGNYSVTVDFNPDKAANRAPVLTNPLTDLTWREGSNLTFSALRTTFSDPDGDKLVFKATLADGSALPSWLSFVPDSGNNTVGGTFSGAPPAGSPDFLVRLAVTDPGGLGTSQTFTIFTPAAAVTPVDTTKVTGTNGKDTITSRPFSETIDGGAGIDTVVYDGLMNKYLAQSVGGVISVRGFAGSDLGVDQLTNVERLRFTDGSLAFDLNGNAGKVARIIGAVFGRSEVSNAGYVSIGLSFIDGGMTYEDLCALAISAAGVSSSIDVVRLLYTNIVGVAPTAAEAAPFVDMLNSGMSVGALGMLAAETSLNAVNIDLIGLASKGLQF